MGSEGATGTDEYLFTGRIKLGGKRGTATRGRPPGSGGGAPGRKRSGRKSSSGCRNAVAGLQAAQAEEELAVENVRIGARVQAAITLV